MKNTCAGFITGDRYKDISSAMLEALDHVFEKLGKEAPPLYAKDAKRKSDFFRDIAGGRFMAIADETAKEAELSFDLMLNVYDKSIIEVENRPPSSDMENAFLRAIQNVIKESPEFNIGPATSPLVSLVVAQTLALVSLVFPQASLLPSFVLSKASPLMSLVSSQVLLLAALVLSHREASSA